MAIRFQHYVPQVYLKAWEADDVCDINTPEKSKGVYYYPKDSLTIGERRNTKSILAEYPYIYGRLRTFFCV